MIPRVDFFQLGTVRRWRGRSLAGFCLVVGGELQLCTVRRCFVLAGSAFGLPDGAGRGLCSRFGVDSPAVNGAAVALSFVERTTRQRKSNEQTIVCMGLALDDSACGFSRRERLRRCFAGFRLAVALDDSGRGLCSRWILFGCRW